MKVYIGCFGSGLGHASRMLEVAAELRARGSEVELSSSGEVASLIESRGYRCNRLPLADVKYSDSGEFLVKDSLLASPSVLAMTYRQVAMETSNIERFSPDVVLSDSALSTVLASRLLRLPIFTVLNQLNLTSSHASEGSMHRLLSVGTSAGMGKFWELSDEVLLPDLPPPYTISERNLWGSNVEKTRYVGFLTATGNPVPDAAAEGFAQGSKPKVFWQVSGPPKTRGPLLAKALQIAEAKADDFSFILTAGNPASGAGPRRLPWGWYYEWCEIADYYFRACDFVVSRAGHGTIGQSIMSSKPSLLIPIPSQPEQEGNAAKASKLGVSLTLPQSGLDIESFSKAAEDLLHGQFRGQAERLAKVARKYDARAEIVRTLEAAARVRRSLG